MSQVSGLRNPDGIFINTQCFREEALNFKKYGYYCPDPEGSPDWERYWTEQRRRWLHGYKVGGSMITGDHYFYLNFCPIIKVEEDKDAQPGKKTRRVKKASKEVDFPDFWDGDYNYYWCREIARNGVIDSGLVTEEEAEKIYHMEDAQQLLKAKELFEGLGLMVRIEPDYLFGGFNLIVGKSRQRGYSFKGASIGVKNYLCRPNQMTIFGAEDKRYLYPKGLFTMANSYLNFVGEHTPMLYPRDVIDQVSKGHIKASTLEIKDGVKIEKGFMSEIYSATFHNDPDAARGKPNTYDLFFEESGSFGVPGLLKEAYKSSEDCVMSGEYKTGMITIFGTSGDMEGGTADYADMFSRPLAFGLLPFQNIWDEDSEDHKCGFFHPVSWNMQGFYDAQGNSNMEAAKEAEVNIRKFRIEHGATATDIQRRMQEKPLGPFEAFGMISTNNFPTAELKRQLEIVKAKKLHLTKGTPVQLIWDSQLNRVTAKPILDMAFGPKPIYYRKPEDTDWRGCPIVYEYPPENPTFGTYKIGFDPYRQDKGSSLGAIIVYKPVIMGQYTKKIIVAEYIGRPESADDVTYIAYLFARLYNTRVMHENEVTHVKDWFRKRKLFQWLAHQPDAVISKAVKNSRVARIYGCHMIEQLKDAGEKYIKDWLLEVINYDEHGNPVRVLDSIYSIGLLEELIAYNRKDNFDRVMALMQAMFQDQEDLDGKQYKAQKDVPDKVKELIETMNSLYPKNTADKVAHSIN